MHTIEYYSAIKRMGSKSIYSNMGGPRDSHTKFSVSQTEKDKYHVVLLICGI